MLQDVEIYAAELGIAISFIAVPVLFCLLFAGILFAMQKFTRLPYLKVSVASLTSGLLSGYALTVGGTISIGSAMFAISILAAALFLFTRKRDEGGSFIFAARVASVVYAIVFLVTSNYFIRAFATAIETN